MPASTSTRLTLAHAKASARLPNSVMSAHTATPTTHAVRKQPRRKVGERSHAGCEDVEAERPPAERGQQHEDGEAAHHPHEPGARA